MLFISLQLLRKLTRCHSDTIFTHLHYLQTYTYTTLLHYISYIMMVMIKPTHNEHDPISDAINGTRDKVDLEAIRHQWYHSCPWIAERGKSCIFLSLPPDNRTLRAIENCRCLPMTIKAGMHHPAYLLFSFSSSPSPLPPPMTQCIPSEDYIHWIHVCRPILP